MQKNDSLFCPTALIWMFKIGKKAISFCAILFSKIFFVFVVSTWESVHVEPLQDVGLKQHVITGTTSLDCQHDACCSCPTVLPQHLPSMALASDGLGLRSTLPMPDGTVGTKLCMSLPFGNKDAVAEKRFLSDVFLAGV